MLRSKNKSKLVDLYLTLKDYLMTSKKWSEVNKPTTMLCLVETEDNVPLKQHSELTKSLKDKVLSEELKTILPLVLLH